MSERLRLHPLSVELQVAFPDALGPANPLHVAVSGRTAWRNTSAYVSRNRATTRETASVATPNALGH